MRITGFSWTTGSSQWGFTVRTADNGQEALQQWQQEPPDLIFMDLRMPGIWTVRRRFGANSAKGAGAQAAVPETDSLASRLQKSWWSALAC